MTLFWLGVASGVAATVLLLAGYVWIVTWWIGKDDSV